MLFCENVITIMTKYMVEIQISKFKINGFSRGVNVVTVCYFSFPDIVSIPKTNENFRLLYDTKGRFRLHSVRDEESKVGICILY